MAQGKIVLMACGSFSPPTYMHLRLFEIARDYIHALGVGSVIGGIMSPVHDAYGKKELVAAHHRISMLDLALRSSSWIKVSEWETQQEGWTRTRVSLGYHQDTINTYFKRPTNDPPSWLPDDVINNSMDAPDNMAARVNGNLDEEVKVKLLCGADLLESFATPGLWSDEDMEAIVGRHGLVVITRSGSNPDRFIYESDMLYKYRKNIMLITNHISNEVSSTIIRRLVRRGDSAKYLTPDDVISYIRQQSLYGAIHEDTEYSILNDIISIYDKKSPQDAVMASPEETNFKNILISIRDKPSIVDETITVKKPRKNYLTPFTDLVAPKSDVAPKIGYTDKANFRPGKAVKIVSSKESYDTVDEKVSGEYASLDSYLSNQNGVDYDVIERRVSEGYPENSSKMTLKKRTSSTIRKLTKNMESVKKSRSEVSKLCEKMRNVKLRESGKNYKTRSCNDIVRLVLTKHGIHVISDTEAIV